MQSSRVMSRVNIELIFNVSEAVAASTIKVLCDECCFRTVLSPVPHSMLSVVRVRTAEGRVGILFVITTTRVCVCMYILQVWILHKILLPYFAIELH
jgi:hypothetical protein